MPSASFSHLPPLFVTSRDGLSRVRLQEISTLVSALSFGIHLFASFAFTSAAQSITELAPLSGSKGILIGLQNFMRGA
ncbi:uncharacterized protein LOC129290211 isoform X2 [Prosopis cineraria]|uniref:uncharacterized protein LOC129290211 isoform X2 n=1 Tax=Prosopis cineraria TaxID=364024 RepID=UPI0024108EAB|nr:uncharacterized protein LOC129290211 isoform X2 [Prosopis cineraria]